MKKTERKNKYDREPSWILFILLLLLYLITSFVITRISRSDLMIPVLGGMIPLSACTGVLSPLANICVIFMVVFFKRTGFITSLVLLCMQYPVMLYNLFFRHNLSALPGVFSNLLTVIAVCLIYSSNRKIEGYRKVEYDYLREQQKTSMNLFEQTATALVNAIDAKDTYSHGHSLRVAEYSEKIAKMLGKDEVECRKVYYAGLLHDVGKIGIPNNIINKKGKLTPEEYELIKEHPVKGSQILSGISEFPYLSIGARNHHERYDGKGYPDRLKGEDIPEIARIISVADAYDAMSSHRSYRKAIPQQLVREEIVKGTGTQFDPVIAKVMQQLIDYDPDYRMKEKELVNELAGREALHCEEHRSEISDGINITQNMTMIRMTVTPDEGSSGKDNGASFILFDALDSRVHVDYDAIRQMCYYEYCEFWPDGRIINIGDRKAETVIEDKDPAKRWQDEKGSVTYEIDAVKVRDHVQIRIDDGAQITQITIALPDCSRFAFIGLTGEHCTISNVSIMETEDAVPDDYIRRIAEEITYIDGPEGDIPNLQVDNYRTATTEGIPLQGKLKITFRTRSLPTARLVWHCPYFVIYSSDDGRMHGEKYREHGFIRLDGEEWESEGCARNKLTVTMREDFRGWDAWKETNKSGFESTAFFSRRGNTITMTTENLGIALKNTTTILDGSEDVYVALTGDQCALTNIRIKA